MPRVRVRRLIRVLVTAAALGLLSSIATCWTIALTTDMWLDYTISERPLHPQPEVQGTLNVVRIDAFGSTFTEANIWGETAGRRDSERTPESLVASIGIRRAIPWGSADRPWRLYDEQCIEARGWPLHCAWCRVLPIHNTSGASTIPTGATIEGGIEIPQVRIARGLRAFDGPAAFPLRPIWVGLAANTFAFGSFWVLLLCTLGALRRSIRRRRGRCPRCAYDLRGLPVDPPCPECGAGGNKAATRRPAPQRELRHSPSKDLPRPGRAAPAISEVSADRKRGCDHPVAPPPSRLITHPS